MEAILEVGLKILGWVDVAVGGLALLMALLLITDGDTREGGKGLLLGVVAIAIGGWLLGWW